MKDTMKIVITINKEDLPKFIDKFNVTEYHFKNSEVTIDMTTLFSEGEKQYVEEKKGSDATMF